MAAKYTSLAPADMSILAHSAAVEPVVTMSSSSRIRLPVILALLHTF